MGDGQNKCRLMIQTASFPCGKALLMYSISHLFNAVKSNYWHYVIYSAFSHVSGVGSPPSSPACRLSASNVPAAGRASVWPVRNFRKGETGGRDGPAGFCSSYFGGASCALFYAMDVWQSSRTR